MLISIFCIYSCSNHQSKRVLNKKNNYFITKQKAIKFLKNRGINCNKAYEVDTNKMKWVNNRNNNDTINSFSKEWGYLEALDDIKNKRILLIKMGPPPSPKDIIFWKLLRNNNINIKLNLECHPDSGAIAYNEIMYDYIDYKFGKNFLHQLSKKAKLISNL